LDYPKVSIIVLNWNGLDDTIECLESLHKITYPNYQVIVVDNGSEGEDVRVLGEKFGYYVHIIENDRNYGFAEGNNIGMRYAINSYAPDYLLLLNNDTVVAPDFLDELVKVVESDSKIGIASPKIYYYEFKSRNDVIWFAGGRIEWWRRWVYPHIGCRDNDLPQYQKITTVDWASGAAMLLKSSVVEKLSLLNSGYFFGNEDVEYCIKARKNGFNIVYVPAARVWHKIGMTRDKLGVPKGKDEPDFVSLYPYYRFIRRNFSSLVYVYHLLLLPTTLFQWGLSYIVRRRDKDTLFRFIKTLLPGRERSP